MSETTYYQRNKEVILNRSKDYYKNNKEVLRKRVRKDKKNKPININEVDTKKILLSNKIPYGEHGTNKYYIAYLNGGFKPLHIIIKDIKLYTNHMNVLANVNELLKYIEIWNKIESLFNKKFNSKPTYSNKYIRTKISSYDENFQGNKRLTEDEYYRHSILLIEFICEVENKYYPQTFLDEFFECNSVECNFIKCNFIEKHNDNNKNSLFKELVQLVDWSDDDEACDKSL